MSTSDTPADLASQDACPFASASMEAKRLAAAVLEVLAGARLPSEAAAVLQVSVGRYYQLESRALGGLVAACEPRRRGRGRKSSNEASSLRQECDRLRRECARQQALVRAAQRTVGLPAPAGPPNTEKGGKKRRKRKPTARALKMAALLQGSTPTASIDATAEPTLAGS